MINYCKCCGLPFRRLTKRHKYCNRCKSKGISYYNKNPTVKKVCPICKEEFETNLTIKVYCGDTCRNLADDRSGPPREVICGNCNEVFITRKKNKKFCSNNCYIEHKAKESQVGYRISRSEQE